MTQLGQQNHYDIKYLKGYGSGISVKNQRIVLKNGTDVFSQEQETEEYIPQTIPYSRIVLGKDGYISNKAVQLLADNYISLIFVDSFGNFKACLHQVMSSFTGSKRRTAQYDTFRNPEKVLYLQKELVKAKLQSEIDFVKDESVKSKLRKFQKYVSNAISYKEILSHEAKSGIIYRKIVPKKA